MGLRDWLFGPKSNSEEMQQLEQWSSQGARYTHPAEQIKTLKRQGDFAEAERLLLTLLDEGEDGAGCSPR